MKFNKLTVFTIIFTILVAGVFITRDHLRSYYFAYQANRWLIKAWVQPDLFPCEIADPSNSIDQTNINKSIYYAKNALELSPENKLALNVFGRSACFSGKPLDATIAYQKLLEIYSNSPLNWVEYGLALALIGREDEASAAWKHANITATDFYNTGLELLANHEFSRAETWLLYSLILDPSFREAWSKLGDLYIINKNLDDAETAFEKAINLGDENSVIKLFELDKTLGDQEQQINHLMEAIDAFPQSEKRAIWYSLLGESYRNSGELEQATKVFLQGLHAYSTDPYLLVGYAYTIWEINKIFTKALPSLQKCIDNHPDLGICYFAYGDLLFRSGQFNEAIPWLDEAIKLEPDNSVWHWKRAETLRFAGQIADAISLSKLMIEKFPDYPAGYIELAKNLMAVDDPMGALNTIEKGLNTISDFNLQLYLFSADTYLSQNRLKDAEDLYVKILLHDPQNAIAIAELQKIQNKKSAPDK